MLVLVALCEVVEIISSGIPLQRKIQNSSISFTIIIVNLEQLDVGCGEVNDLNQNSSRLFCMYSLWYKYVSSYLTLSNSLNLDVYSSIRLLVLECVWE